LRFEHSLTLERILNRDQRDTFVDEQIAVGINQPPTLTDFFGAEKAGPVCGVRF